MNCILRILILFPTVLTWQIIAAESLPSNSDNSTVHFFLVMVPESKIDSLRKRAARQEEGAEGAAEAVGAALGPAANIGQILQGVLGGDLRPIFAGSTAFIPEGDFRDGVTGILQQTIAPAIQRILGEFFNSTNRTPRPTVQNQNQLLQPGNNNFNQYQQFQPQQIPQQVAGVAGFPINQQNQFQPGNFNPAQQNQLFQQPNFPPTQQFQNQNPSLAFQPGTINPQNQFPQQNLPNYNQFLQNINQQPTLNQQANNPAINNSPSINSLQNQQQQQLLQQLQHILAQANLNQLAQQSQTIGQNQAINAINGNQNPVPNPVNSDFSQRRYK